MTTTYSDVHGLTFVPYLRWGLYSVGPPPVFGSSPAVPSSWRRTAASARSVTHHTSVFPTTLQRVSILVKFTLDVCELPPGAAVLLVVHTRACVWSPVDTALCTHLQMETQTGCSCRRTQTVEWISFFFLNYFQESAFTFQQPFRCELGFKDSQLKDFKLPNTQFVTISSSLFRFGLTEAFILSLSIKAQKLVLNIRHSSCCHYLLIHSFS